MNKTMHTTSEVKPYSLFTYSDGTVRDTRVIGRGAPKKKLDNGATLVSMQRFLPTKITKGQNAEIERVTEVVPGLAKRETILTYSDGSNVKVEKGGHPIRVLANGAVLTKVTTRTPDKSAATKLDYDIVFIEDTSKPYSVFVYADGTRTSTKEIGSGRPVNYRNGSPLVRIEKHTVKKNDKPVYDLVTVVDANSEKPFSAFVYANGTVVTTLNGGPRRPAYAIEGSPLVRIERHTVVKQPRTKAEKQEARESAKKELSYSVPSEIKVGDTLFHEATKAPVTVLSFIEGNDTQVICEMLLNGIKTSGKVLISKLLEGSK